MRRNSLLALLLLASPAFAQTPVPVVNPSFEASGGWTFGPGSGPWAPGSGAYASIPDGKLIGYANANGSITQDLGVSALSNNIYTLQLWVGHRLDGYAAKATIQLLAGTTSLCSLTVDSSTIPAGTFAQQTLTCPVGATAPTGDLIISVVSAGTQTDIDNVTLSYAPATPQSFVWQMPGLGTVTFPMQIPPACGPSDGVCSIQIQIVMPAANGTCSADSNQNITCTGNAGTLNLIKTVSLPVPQTQTIVVAIASP
jgi:hypothetical protein